jgi:hypothetical protein
MPRRWVILLSAIAVVATVALWPPPRRYDKREHPLAHPIAASVTPNGAVRLADGRELRPAGIVLPEGVDQRAQSLAVMSAAVRQGVEVRAVLDDGSAFFVCEPRFNNWCGTGRLGGVYAQCGLSELLVVAKCASVDPTAKVTEADERRLRTAAGLSKDVQPVDTLQFHAGKLQMGDILFAMERFEDAVEYDLYPKSP